MAENITCLARERISRLPYFGGDETELHFSNEGPILTVSGRVPSFFAKQVLYRTLGRLEGVERIDDQVQVAYCRTRSRNQFAEMRNLQS